MRKLFTFCMLGIGLVFSMHANIYVSGNTSNEFLELQKMLQEEPPGIPVLPLQDFESDTAWTLTNGTQSSKWRIGNASNITGRGKVAFISDDSISNKYSATSITFLCSKGISYPANSNIEEYILSFDWRSEGNVAYDALRIGLYDPAYNLTAGTSNITTTGATNLLKRDLKLQSDWQTLRVFLMDTLNGKSKKLVYQWYSYVNASNPAVNPPAAIDNVSIMAYTCAMPKNLQATAYPDPTSINLIWTAYNKRVPTFNVFYRKSEDPSDTIWNKKTGLTGTSYLLTDLTSNTGYEIRIQKQYSASDTSLWSDPIFVRTSLPTAKASFTDNFESFDNTKRAIINFEQTNKWEIGTATYNGTTGKSIYISNDGGNSNQYNMEAMSISHLYYDVEFPDTGSFRLAFDWKNNGRSTDFMRVSLVELTDIPFAEKVLPMANRLFGKDFYARTTWKHEELVFSNNLAGTKKRLVFTWQNTGIGGTQTPIALDNVKVEAFVCTMPENLQVSAYPNPNTLRLQWNIPSENTNFVVAYAPAGSNNWVTRTANSNPFDLNQLAANTIYDIKVRTVCSADTSLYTKSIEGVTSQEPLILSPLQTENFESNSSQQWRIVNGEQSNKWMVGTNTSTGTGNHSLYITTDTAKGINEFSIFQSSIVHTYRDIKFPNAVEHVLTFDWKGLGSVKDSAMMNVYLVDVNKIPKAGDTVGLGKFIGTKSFSNNSDWRNDTIVIKGSDAKDTTKRLVFTWINTGINGKQPPVAVDNIKLQSLQCPQPQNLKVVEYVDSNAVKIQFGGMKGFGSFIVYAKTEDGNLTTFTTTDTIVQIKPLQPNTVYTVQVQNACTSDSSRWSAPINNFRMPQSYALATKSQTFIENFEDDDNTEKWTILNGTYPNKWFIDRASFAPGEGNRGAYIDSTEDGTSNAYSAKSTSHIHLYRDIQFDSAAEKTLTFDWKCKGSLYYGNFYVSIVDLEYIPIAGTEIPTKSSTALTRYKSPAKIYSTDDLWKKAEIVLPSGDTLSGKKKRLVFSWFNSSPAAQPPVTIDNVTITAVGCATPTNLIAKTVWADSIALQWTSTGNNFEVAYKRTTETEWSEKQTTTAKTYTIKGLSSNTLYDVAVTNKCGGSAIPKIISVRTKQKAANVSIESYNNDFENNAEIIQWTTVDQKIGMDNKWYIGSIGDVSYSNIAFISNDGGAHNEYSIKQDSVNVSHIYRDIQFGTHAAYQLTFDWRAMGETYSDYLKVFLVDTSVSLVAGKEIAGTPVFQTTRLNMSKDWHTATYQIKSNFPNTQKRLVFSWTNDKSNGEQPPAAFDNIQIQPLDCPTPANLRVTAYPSVTSVVVAWDSVAPNTVVRYRIVTPYNSETWTLDTVYGKKFDTIKGLQGNNAPYEIQVNSICTGNYLMSETIFILTAQTPTSANGFSENFNNPATYTEWGILDKNSENGWYLGTAAYSGANDTSIYISNENGINNAYTANGQPTVVHFYRDFEYELGLKEIEVAFDWKAVGDTADYLQAYIVSTNAPLNIGTQLPASAKLFAGKLNNNLEWSRAVAFKKKIDLPQDVFRLVFSWTNDNAEGKQMPAAIDNISVKSYKCLSVQNITTTKITADSISLTWTTQESGSTYSVQYKEVGAENMEGTFELIANTAYTLTNLNANKLYEIQVKSVCTDGESSAWVSHKVRTKQTPSSTTFTETFENVATHQNWTTLADQQENKWVIDSNSTDKDGKYAAYISNDEGKTNMYSDIHTNNMVYTHLYREIQFGNAAQYFLSFVWKNTGDLSDYMQVSLVPDNVTIKAGDSISAIYRLFNKKFFSSNNQWIQDSLFVDPSAWNNKKGSLVFTWINNASIALQKPATIENIKFRALDCKTPTNLSVTDYPSGTSLSLLWHRVGNTSFTVGYKESGSQSAYTEKTVTGDSTTTITGLKTLTAYEIVVKANCTQVAWSVPILVKTSLEPVKTFPMVETFETTPNSNWVIANGTMPNKWVIGSATYTGANSQKSIYISNDGGTTNVYNGNAASIVHFYRDIKFLDVDSNKKFELSFDWKVLGNQYDRMQVYLVDVNQEPTAGMELPIANRIGIFYGTSAASWKFGQITLPAHTYSDKLKRLVFTWLNNEENANQPPVAIDNISLTAYTCDAPTNVVAKTLDATSVQVTWQGSPNSYTLQYRPTGYKETYNFESVTVNGKSDTLEDLQSGINYEFRVLANGCTTGLSMPAEGKFSMPYQLPFFENFDDFAITNSYIVPPANWINRYAPDFVTNASTGIFINPDTTIAIAGSKNNSWLPSNFADKYGASKSARMGLFNTNTADWLITPKIDLGTESGRRQIEFKLVLINQTTTRDTIDPRSTDDRFGIFVSTDDNWSMDNALDIWDQGGKNRSIFQINGTRDGEKVRFYLDDYTGIIRIGFYGESTVSNGYNYLYIDSILVKNVTCNTVTDVVINNIDLHAATVNWTVPDMDQDRWEVKYSTNAQDVQTVEVLDDTYTTLSNLRMGTEYDVSVRALCDGVGESDWSPVKTFQTLSTCAGIPDSLHIVPAYDSATVSWAAGTNNASWLVRYGTPDQDRNTMTVVSATGTSYTIHGLTELTDYVVYIRAICTDDDTSGWSSLFTFTTTQIPCDSVWNLRSSNISASTATVAWDAKEGQSQFELRYGASNNIDAMRSIITNSKSTDINDLANDTRCYFYVRSICSANDSSAWSTVDTFTTLACIGVDVVNLVSLSPDSTTATVNWNSKTGQTDWRVNIAEYGKPIDQGKEYFTTDTFYVFNNLIKMKYQIVVQAKCGTNNEFTTQWSAPLILDLSNKGIDILWLNNIQIALTPNPAKECAKLSITGAEGIVKVNVTSVNGEVIATEKLNCSSEQTKELTLNGLAKGTYIIHLIHNNWTTTRKLIVQ